MKTLVIGLGNPILCDDGVGVRVAAELAGMLEDSDGINVDVIEASVGGLRLMELMQGYDRVILVDALLGPGAPPGTIKRLTLSDLERITPPQHVASAHDTTLITALQAGRRLGLALPESVVIYGIFVEKVDEFGEEPTPAVARAIPQATAAVLSELRAAI
ncbi:MAG: hydrogenase maturation protease [Caldilineae bacterium]|nr:MAG: hydrogenase maturation protease [Caldilineae bacterium]